MDREELEKMEGLLWAYDAIREYVDMRNIPWVFRHGLMLAASDARIYIRKEREKLDAKDSS